MKMFVKPGAGLRVKHPDKINYFFTKDGEMVERTTGIIRLLRTGDLVEVKVQGTSAAPSTPTSTTGAN